jgi:hypothetical protein
MRFEIRLRAVATRPQPSTTALRSIIIRLVPLHKDYDSFVGCALMLAGSG